MSYRLFAMSSFADLYPERRGGSVSPSVLQRATGTEYFSAVCCESGSMWCRNQLASLIRITDPYFFYQRFEKFQKKMSIFFFI